MDGTNFLYQLGNDGKNHIVAPNVEKLAEYEGHDMTECGVAEVEIKFIRWAKEPKHDHKRS